MLNSCLVVARADDPASRAAFQSRFEDLVRFYEPISDGGNGSASCQFLEGQSLLVGEIAFGRAARADGDCRVWGEALPPILASSSALLAASDSELRSIEGVTAVVAAGWDRVRLITGAGGLTTLYAAGSAGTMAWSTHAVAAAWMGTGTARIDPQTLPELLVMEFVGGDRTLIEGTRAVPPATCIEVGQGGATTRSFWTANDRWEPIPEEEAQDQAESALLSSVSRRLSGNPRPFLGLTAGVDSRVVAVAMKELGIEFETFTWGEPQWQDSVTARDMATELGVPHHLLPPGYLDDEDALARVDRDVRWNEGMLRVGFAHPTWPSATTAFVSGTAAETGRAAYLVYFMRLASADPNADTRMAARYFSRVVDNRLRFTRKEVRENLRRRIESWVFEAERLGYSGWRTLDVVYAEQRVRRWARAYLPQADFPVIPPFTSPEVLRSLACLPLHQRISNGFHREFLRMRQASLVPMPPAHPELTRFRIRERIPPSVRRLRSRAMRRRRPPRDWFLAQGWGTRPLFREWIADEVLMWPALAEATSPRWLRGVRDGFLRDDNGETTTALLAAAPVALASALEDLRRTATPATGLAQKDGLPASARPHVGTFSAPK